MEIVVVQDGGAPREVRVAVARIVADLDAGQGRVRLHRCPRRLGQPEIFNACVRLARGRWVHVLPDDDWVEPGFYAALRAGIEGSPAGSAFCRYAAHAADGGEWLSRLEREEPGILGDWLPRTATLCRQVVAATVVRRDVYEALGGFSAAAGTAFDWEMWQRAATYYPVWYEPRRLVVSRSDGTALSDGLRRTGQSVIDSLAAIDLAQTYLPPGLASDLRGGARRRYARHALGVAEQALARSDYRAALENLRASLLAHHDETTWPRVMAVLEASAR